MRHSLKGDWIITFGKLNRMKRGRNETKLRPPRYSQPGREALAKAHPSRKVIGRSLGSPARISKRNSQQRIPLLPELPDIPIQIEIHYGRTLTFKTLRSDIFASYSSLKL
jgi:hypothetical protein